MNDGAVLDFADYPMTPVSVMPLHFPEFLDYREWYACGLGNPTKLTPRYDWRCANCRSYAAKVLRESGSDPVQWWWPNPDSVEPIQVRLSWLVARAGYWASSGSVL